ncbi:hook-length control protein FliK [Jhaorihella thermophila]|uniref:Hook-length control protein FliK n=2 Tax=Jhaorihella thermophila TaxID=488547 RepID=A0A1H5U6M1_9RHOB|nr:hook-length control protein FliK [Jhaorihella thermophila]
MKASAASRRPKASESQAEVSVSDETGDGDRRSDDDLPGDAGGAADPSEPKALTSTVPTDGDFMSSQRQGAGSRRDLPTCNGETSARPETVAVKRNTATTAADGTSGASGVSGGSGVSQSVHMPSGAEGGRFTIFSGGKSVDELPAPRSAMKGGHEGQATDGSNAARGNQIRAQAVAGMGAQGAVGSVEQQSVRDFSQAQFLQVPSGLKDSRNIAGDAVTFSTTVQADGVAYDAASFPKGHFAPESGPKARFQIISEGAAGAGHRASATSNMEAVAIISDITSQEGVRVHAEGSRPEASVDRTSPGWREPGWVSEYVGRSFGSGGASWDRPVTATGELQGSLALASHSVQSGTPAAHQGSGTIDGSAVLHGVRLDEWTATDMIRYLSRGPDGAIEVALDPVELGRVRMRLHPQADGVAVAISADRSETVELMRQYAGGLGEALRGLGYENVTFSFSEDSGRNAQSRQEAWTQGDPSDDVEPDGSANLAHTRSGRVAPGEGMDLRL